MWQNDILPEKNNNHDCEVEALQRLQDTHFNNMWVVQYLVQSAIDGYNVCIFAFGQTGSGKTYTIYGTDNNPGLTPRVTRELFSCIKRDANKFQFSLQVPHQRLDPCSEFDFPFLN